MRYFLLALVLTSLIGNCYSQSSKSYFDETIPVDSNNIPINKGQYYFPIELFPTVTEIWNTVDNKIQVTRKYIENEYDTNTVAWYSAFLYVMHEPLLYNKQFNKEIFRFTWLRSFHNPVVIRIEKNNDNCILFWKVWDGKGGYGIGDLFINKYKVLSSTDWTEFESLLDKADFWNIDLGRSTLGDDGAEWILEGADSSKYRVVTYWSPDTGSFYNLCSYLISLTDLSIPGNEFY